MSQTQTQTKDSWGEVRSILAQEHSHGVHKKTLAQLHHLVSRAPCGQRDALRAYIYGSLPMYFMEAQSQKEYLRCPGLFNCIPLRKQLLNQGFADWVYGGPSYTDLLKQIETPPYGAILTAPFEGSLSDYKAQDFVKFRGIWLGQNIHILPDAPQSPKLTLLSTVYYGRERQSHGIIESKMPLYPVNTHLCHIGLLIDTSLWENPSFVITITYRPAHSLRTHFWELTTACSPRNPRLNDLDVRKGEEGPLIQGLIDCLFPFLYGHYRSERIQFTMWISKRKQALAFLESMEHA